MLRSFAAAAFALACAAPRAQAPAFEVVLRDGTILLASELEDASAGRVRLTTALRQEERAWRDVMSVHGVAAAEASLQSVVLAGGELLRGTIVGGDPGGDFCDVESRSLGRVRVPVDRIECVLLREDLAGPQDLRLPDGVDEALFTKAAVGFDLQAGAIFQFGPLGVSFQPEGQPQPRWFRWQDLVGIRLRDPEPRKVAAGAELVTGAGDRLGVDLVRWSGGTVECKLENGATATLPVGAVASLSLPGAAQALSRQQPTAAVEAGFEGEVLLPWRADRAATGGLLRAGGRVYGSGIGVHARSRLQFRVPDGVDRFWTRVAIDDSVLALPVRGDVDVQVCKNGKPVFEHKGLRGGQAPVSTGFLPVAAGDELELVVDFGKGRDLGDRVDWLGPVFLRGEGGRQ